MSRAQSSASICLGKFQSKLPSRRLPPDLQQLCKPPQHPPTTNDLNSRLFSTHRRNIIATRSASFIALNSPEVEWQNALTKNNNPAAAVATSSLSGRGAEKGIHNERTQSFPESLEETLSALVYCVSLCAILSIAVEPDQSVCDRVRKTRI